MNNNNPDTQHNQPLLGPFLVMRGALIMVPVLLFVFSKLSSGVALAESDPPATSPSPISTPAEPAVQEVVTETSGGSACDVSMQFPAKVRQWCSWITQYANQHEIPSDLIAALIWQESGGDPSAYSHSGAVGLMQVMPRDGIAASFNCPNGPCFASRPTISELEDPEYNISYGVKMLAGLVGRYGDLRQALKAYGPMDVGYSYADTVLGLYQQYRGE